MMDVVEITMSSHKVGQNKEWKNLRDNKSRRNIHESTGKVVRTGNEAQVQAT